MHPSSACQIPSVGRLLFLGISAFYYKVGLLCTLTISSSLAELGFQQHSLCVYGIDASVHTHSRCMHGWSPEVEAQCLPPSLFTFRF